MTPGLISCGARPPPVDGPAFVSKRFHEGGGNGCVAGSDTLKVTAEDAPLTLAIWREVDAMTVVGREREKCARGLPTCHTSKLPRHKG